MQNLQAQQEDQFTMHMLNKYDFNPAYGGLDFSLSSTLVYRNQWDGLEGNVNNMHLNFHMPYYKGSGAIGGMLERKTEGVLALTSLAGSYNYITNLNKGLLSFGGRVGLTHMSVAGDRIITPEGEYQNGIEHNDPILFSSGNSGYGFKVDLGGYYYSKNFQIGLGTSHFPNSNIGVEGLKFDFVTHSNLYFQYNFKIFENILLMQSILLKTDFNQIQTELSSLFKINGNIFGGINVRGFNSQSLDAVSLIVGMQLNENYILAYSYDIGVSGLKGVNDGTHEVILNYNLRQFLGAVKKPKVIYNPRYL